MRAAQAGDTEAFGRVYDLFIDRIYRFIRFRVRDEEEAKDITQQVFMEAWQSLPRFQLHRPFSAWLFAIARFRLIDHYRRYRPSASLEAVTNLTDGTDLGADIGNRLEAERLMQSLQYLPELLRTVVELRLVHQLDYEEIGQLLGKKPATLRVAFKRGLDQLRTIIAKEYE